MTVAVFINSESDATSLIPWGVHFATAEHSELLIVCPRKSKGKKGWDPLEVSEQDDSPLYRTVFEVLSQQDPEKVVLKQKIADGTESTELSRVAIETRELISPNPVETFVEEVEDLKVRLLLLPASEHEKAGRDNKANWTQQLFQNAPCEVAIVSGIKDQCGPPERVLVASHNEITTNDELAAARACQLVKSQPNGKLTLLYVRPDDDDVAIQVAERQLVRLRQTITSKVEVQTRAELSDSFSEAINRLDLKSYDLVLIGTRNPKTIRNAFRGIGKSDEQPIVSVATIRQSVPLTGQLWSKLKYCIRSVVPQMTRDVRVSLVSRLESSSRFDFDFLALISLSTLIAALGLARNSGAVVIGAMLVAPLMTPLVAMGFALVQGNPKLIRNALRSVILGFTVALVIGASVGLPLHIFAPSVEITNEMRGRDMPNLLDLVVALASGVAGAYAMGRPNLISALPGVAIAAALVPPIATSGLALTMGDIRLAGGALLLFLTNIVAIVLGTAVTFWSVGVSTRRVNDVSQSKQSWPRYWFAAFVILSFVLAAVMTILNPLEPYGDQSKKTQTSAESTVNTD